MEFRTRGLHVTTATIAIGASVVGGVIGRTTAPGLTLARAGAPMQVSAVAQRQSAEVPAAQKE
jgi:hypothetical protein